MPTLLMYKSIVNKFESAVKSGALIFTETSTKKAVSHNADIFLTIAPALGQKASSSNNAAAGKSNDPWNPPEEALFVEKGKTHSIVLNKFAVAKYHFLVVTNEFKPQTSPLNEDDWAASLDILRKANSESGHRHVGFFNSGENSGASVAHKHIQIMTLPEDFRPFPDTISRPQASKSLDVGITNNPELPFSHFIAYLSKDASTDEVMVTYYELMTRAFTILAREQAQRSFNVVFTEEWIMVTPRKQEKSHGISINSLGTIGLLLAKNDEQLKLLEENGFDLIGDLGFENDGTAEFNSAVDTHIQY